MLFVTLVFIVFQLIIAVLSPVRFIYVSLWLQTMPYTWNFNTQLVYDTPFGPLAVVAIQLFGFCLGCLLVILPQLERAGAEFAKFRWHVLFLAFCIVSLTYAESSAYGLRMIAKLIGPLLFLVAILTTVTSAEHLRTMRRAILGSGVVLVGLALAARAAGIDSDPNVVNTGLSGLGPPSMGPPVFSAHLLPVAMLALASLLTARTAGNLVLVATFALSIVAALQRTSAGALFLGFSLILFLGTRGVWRLLLPAVGVLCLPALLVFSDTFRRRMFYEAISADSLLADPSKALSGVNGSGRFDLWDNMLGRFFKAHPLTGSGIGSTQEYLYSQSASAAAGVVHSEYVRLLCEVGLIGLSLFAIAMLGYLLRLRRNAAGSNDVVCRASALAAVGALLAYLVFCSTDNAFDYVSQFGIYVFALIGMSMRAADLASSPVAEDAPAETWRGPAFPNLLR